MSRYRIGVAVTAIMTGLALAWGAAAHRPSSGVPELLRLPGLVVRSDGREPPGCGVPKKAGRDVQRLILSFPQPPVAVRDELENRLRAAKWSVERGEGTVLFAERFPDELILEAKKSGERMLISILNQFPDAKAASAKAMLWRVQPEPVEQRDLSALCKIYEEALRAHPKDPDQRERWIVERSIATVKSQAMCEFVEALSAYNPEFPEDRLSGVHLGALEAGVPRFECKAMLAHFQGLAEVHSSSAAP